MSGGGAKGFAYVGLIKVMHEAGLEVDYVAGTSIGSIVAGLYAVGYHPDTMLKVIREQNWDDLLTDKIDRKYIASDEKAYGETFIVSFPVNKKGVSISDALYEGQEVNMLLNRFYSPAYQVSDFSKLQTPFFCVGTDLLTGEAVVLDKGNMPSAIRASMSIPGYFSPVLYDGKYLVDGGVVDNFPVSSVKKKGAQYTLGADVWAGLSTSIDELNTIPLIMGQLINYHAVRANDISIKMTNMYIPIKMKYGVMDFNSYDSIIAIGEQVGREHYAEIKALADSLNAIEFKPVKEYNARPLDSVFISNVIIQGNERVAQSYFDNTFGEFKNSWVSFIKLEYAIHTAYGSGFFVHIFYELIPNGDKTDLLIKVKDANLGFLSVGVNYNTDYSVSILLNGAFRNIIGKGSKIFTNLIVGPNPRFRALFIKDNGYKPGFGAQADIYYFGWNEYASSTNSSAQTGRVFFTNYTASLFGSLVINNKHTFRTGGTYEYFRFKSKMEGVVTDSLSNFNSYGDLFFSFNSDTRDRPYLSRSGVKSEIRVTYVIPLSRNWVDELFANSLVFWLNYEQGIPLHKRIVFKPGIFLGGTFSKDYPASSDESYRNFQLPPAQHWFYMGGLVEKNYIPTFQSFTGVRFVQRYGLYQAIVRTSFQYNFYQKLYLTARGDLGANEWFVKDIFQSENMVVGYGATLSYDSFIGPVELSVMGSNIYKGASFFINLGYWF